MDKSNGYEAISQKFLEIRGQKSNGIGASVVRKWVKKLPVTSKVLDLGCGSGIPITEVIANEKLNVYGVDASPTLVREFERNFPHIPIACETVENSVFFTIKFDAVIAWGLLFLLSPRMQIKLLEKIAYSLNSGGKILFTAPKQKVAWKDQLTGKISKSLGAEKYRKLLLGLKFDAINEFIDEGENYYFEATKVN